MHTHRCKYICVIVRQRTYFREGFQSHRNTQHVPDAVIAGALKNIRQAGVQWFKIEMAV